MDTCVFISYARADGSEYAERLEKDLREAGFDTWRDKRNLNESHDFSAEIEDGILQSSHLIVVCTPSIEANKESFVRREIIYAQKKHKPIIPLIFPDADPIILINNLTYIDFTKGARGSQTLRYDEALIELLQRLDKLRAPEEEWHSNDPFKEYLSMTLDYVLDHLRRTPFALLNVTSEDTHDVLQARSMPMSMSKFSGSTDLLPQDHPAVVYGNLHDAFAANKERLLLLGDPGAGKTTTLFAFARDAIYRRLEYGEAKPLPIVAAISAWDCERYWESLTAWFVQEYPQLKLPLERVLTAGNALLLLDGLDELGSYRVRTIVKSEGMAGDKGGQVMIVQKVEEIDPRIEFLKLLPPNNRIVVSCRDQDYKDMGIENTMLKGAVKLKALEPEQIQLYLKDLPELWDVLQADADLMEVARTPLILSLFTFAFDAMPRELRQLRSLSHGEQREKIFEHYVRRRFERELEKRPENVHYALPQLVETLETLAFTNLANNESENVLLPADIEDIDRDLLDLAVLLNLLTWRKDDSLGFLHLLLRDYFAYSAALQRLDHVDAEVRNAAVEVLKSIDDPRAAERVVNTVLLDADAGIRENAASLLGELGNPMAVDGLLDAIYDPDSIGVQCEAAAALGKLGDVRAVESLIDLLDSDDYALCLNCVSSLGALKDARAVQPLINALDMNFPLSWSISRRNRMLYSIANALASIGEPAIFPLIEVLRHGSAEARRQAAGALGSIGDARAFDALLLALQDEYVAARAAAAVSLGQIGETRAADALIAGLKDSDPHVRGKCASALGTLKIEAAIPHLIALLNDTGDQEESYYNRYSVADDAAEALALIGAASFEPLLTVIAANDDRQVIALNALSQLGDERALPIFITKLRDEDEDVRDAASQALVDANAADAFLVALEDSNAAVREIAVKALEELEHQPAADALLRLLRRRDPSSAVRIAVIEALVALEAENAGSALVSVLRSDPDLDVRNAAAEALGELQFKGAIPQLAEALSEEALWENAFEALGILNALTDPRIEARVLPMLAPDYPFVMRRKVAVALAKAGDLRTLEPLMILLRDDDETDDNNRGRTFDTFSDLVKEKLPETDAHYDLIKAIDCLIDGTYAEAIPALDRAVEAQPDKWYHWYWRSEMRYSWLKQDFELALADIETAYKLAPHIDSVAMNYIYVLSELGRDEEALRLLDERAATNPSSWSNHFARGRVHYEAKRDAEALAAFTQAISLRPDHAGSYNWRGSVLYRMKDFPTAVEDFEKAIELDPDDANHYVWLGDTYEEMGDYEQAISVYRRIPHLDQDQNSLVKLARIQQNAGDEASALESINAALELKADDEDTLWRRGWIYYQQGSYAEARTDFQSALDLNPRSAYNHCWLGDALNRLGETRAALVHYQRALEIEPDHADAYTWVGAWYGDQEDFEQAHSAFSRAIELNPDSERVYRWRAALCLNTGDYAQAMEDVEKAIAINPYYNIPYYWRAMIHLEQGSFDAALIDLQAALDKHHPNEHSIYYWRAVIFTRQGKRDEADSALAQLEALLQTGTPSLKRIPILRDCLAARIALLRGDEARARAFYAKVIAAQPGRWQWVDEKYTLLRLVRVLPDRADIRTVSDWFTAAFTT